MILIQNHNILVDVYKCLYLMLKSHTITVMTWSGNSWASIANSAVTNAEQPSASTIRQQKHITMKIIPSGHMSKVLKQVECIGNLSVRVLKQVECIGNLSVRVLKQVEGIGNLSVRPFALMFSLTNGRNLCNVIMHSHETIIYMSWTTKLIQLAPVSLVLLQEMQIIVS